MHSNDTNLDNSTNARFRRAAPLPGAAHINGATYASKFGASEQTMRMDFLFSLRALLEPKIEYISQTPEGLRYAARVVSGDCHGPELKGDIKSAGGDWLLVRKDGVGLIDVRFTMETADGAVIYGTHGGLVDFGADGFAALVGKRRLDEIDGRITARYQTDHPQYAWLNRVQCVGTLVADFKTFLVSTEIYALF